jgi:hypothetical protein
VSVFEAVEVYVAVPVPVDVRVKVGVLCIVAVRVYVDVGVLVEVETGGVIVGVGGVTLFITRYCRINRYMSTSSDGANHMFFVVPPSPYVVYT